MRYASPLFAAALSMLAADALGDEGPVEAPSPDAENDAGLGRAVLGAAPPALGGFVLHGSLGAVLILPHLTAGVRAGLGAGFGVDVSYRNLAAFGHEGRLQVLWGMEIADGVDVGLRYQTAISSLELADDTVAGIQFSTLPLANDWTMGNRFVLSFNRAAGAHITAAAGLLFTLGGVRFIGFEEKAEGFTFDPAARAVETSIQGEWELWSNVNVFARLDAQFLLGIEKDEACQAAKQNECTQLVPFGFLPTGTVGLAWAP